MEESLVVDLSLGNPEEAAFQSCTYTSASAVAPVAVIFTAAFATVTSTRHEIGLNTASPTPQSTGVTSPAIATTINSPQPASIISNPPANTGGPGPIVSPQQPQATDNQVSSPTNDGNDNPATSQPTISLHLPSFIPTDNGENSGSQGIPNNSNVGVAESSQVQSSPDSSSSPTPESSDTGSQQTEGQAQGAGVSDSPQDSNPSSDQLSSASGAQQNEVQGQSAAVTGPQGNDHPSANQGSSNSNPQRVQGQGQSTSAAGLQGENSGQISSSVGSQEAQNQVQGESPAGPQGGDLSSVGQGASAPAAESVFIDNSAIPDAVIPAQQQQTAVSNNNAQALPGIVFGGSTLTPNSNGVYSVGTQAITPGGSAVVVSGTSISVAAQRPAMATAAGVVGLSPAPLDTVNNVFVLGSQTLTAGGAPIAVAGTPVSIPSGASNVVVAGSTQTLPSVSLVQTTGLKTFAVAGQTVTQNAAGSFVVGSSTIAPGSTITIAGKPVSLPTSGGSVAVVAGSSVTLSGAVARNTEDTATGELIVAGQTLTTNAAGSYVVGSATIAPGGIIDVDGTLVGLPTKGGSVALVGSSVMSLGTENNSVQATMTGDEIASGSVSSSDGVLGGASGSASGGASGAGAGPSRTKSPGAVYTGAAARIRQRRSLDGCDGGNVFTYLMD